MQYNSSIVSLPPRSRNYADLVYLTWVDSPLTTMTIQWHTVETVAGSDPDPEVKYRIKGDSEWSNATGTVKTMFGAARLADIERKVHWTTLTDLNPGTSYEFMFTGDRRKKIYKFKTMPEDLSEPLKIAVAGDPHWGIVPANVPGHFEMVRRMTREIGKYNPDFIICVGDYTYDEGEATTGHTRIWIDFLKYCEKNFVSKDGYIIPFITAVGNHDTGYEHFGLRGPGNASNFETLFAFPVSQNYLYGKLDFGDYLQLLALDTDHGSEWQDLTNWIDVNIDGSKTHVIPFYHRPMYDYRRGQEGKWSQDIIDAWCPLFENAGVKIALEGHLHNYGYTKPIKNDVVDENGIVYCGQGSWGLARPHNHLLDGEPETEPYYFEKFAFSNYKSENVHHFYGLTLYPDRIKVESINKNGAVFDTFERLI